MKKKKVTTYNWYFWIPEYKMQVVIEKSSYYGAVQHLKDALKYYNKPCPKFEFQFGDKIVYH